MGKFWLKSVDPLKQCCGCEGKSGPCNNCCSLLQDIGSIASGQQIANCTYLLGTKDIYIKKTNSLEIDIGKNNINNNKQFAISVNKNDNIVVEYGANISVSNTGIFSKIGSENGLQGPWQLTNYPPNWPDDQIFSAQVYFLMSGYSGYSINTTISQSLSNTGSITNNVEVITGSQTKINVLSANSETITYRSGLSNNFFSGNCYSMPQIGYNPIYDFVTILDPNPIHWSPTYVIAIFNTGNPASDYIIQGTVLVNERYTFDDMAIIYQNNYGPGHTSALANWTTPSFLNEIRINVVGDYKATMRNLMDAGNVIVGLGYGNFINQNQPTTFVIQYYKPEKQSIIVPINTKFTLNMNSQNCLQFKSDLHSDLDGSLILTDINALNIPKIQFVSGNKSVSCPNQ